tara:strand:- start:14622 stop:15893 length:1272 start_codon:yes stop_codon:yes gene_type:complete
MDLITLYKFNLQGKILYFKVGTYQDTSDFTKANIKRSWGHLDGIPTIQTTSVKGKNIGRSNATSACGQAIKEATALWKKKKGEGYKSLVDLGFTGNNDQQALRTILENNLPKTQRDGGGRVKPMLLYEARTPFFPKDVVLRKKAKRKDVTFPCIGEFKYDGVCTIATPGFNLLTDVQCTLSTRSGKDRHTPKGQKWDAIVPHIVEQLQDVWRVLELHDMFCYTFHGETYKHGLTLQEIQKANKKVNNDSSSMELYIFDIVNEELDMVARRDIMRTMAELIETEANAPNVHFVLGEVIYDEDSMFVLEKRALKAKYEGFILRHFRGMYRIGGRSVDVLKGVRMDKSEYMVHDIVPMDKAPDMGKFVCNHAGKPFFVTPGKGYSHALRRKLLKNKWDYINTVITVYHRGFTDDGLPRIATAPKLK